MHIKNKKKIMEYPSNLKFYTFIVIIKIFETSFILITDYR